MELNPVVYTEKVVRSILRYERVGIPQALVKRRSLSSLTWVEQVP